MTVVAKLSVVRVWLRWGLSVSDVCRLPDDFKEHMYHSFAPLAWTMQIRA